MNRTPAPPADSLSRLLDEALALLEPRYPALPGPAAPLPSLLDRCEALVARAAAPAPARLVLSFGQAAGRAGIALLQELPNLHLLPGSGLRPEGGALAGIGPALRIEAACAMFDTLDSGCRARGTRLVLHHDGSPDHARLPADPAALLPVQMRKRRPVAAVILTDHPLLCWMELHRRGGAGYHPARLEDFSERYLAFLDAHDGLPRLDSAEIAADPEAALRRLATLLALGPGPEALPDPLEPATGPGGPILEDADGTPATEEPLDSPAYLALCARLGHDPARLPAAMPVLTAPPPARPRAGLPRPAAGRPLARLAAILPRITQLAPAPAGAPARLLGPAELTGMVEDCLGHPDGFYERLDQLLAGLSPADGALLLIGCAAHYTATGEAAHGLGLLARAELLISPGDRPLRLLAAEVLLTLGNGELALATLVADALDGPLALPSWARDSLRRFGRLKAGRDRAGMTGMAGAAPVVVIAGMRHSGSTALFNIVRLGFAATGSKPLVGYSEIGDIVTSARHSVQPTIVKTHEMRDDVRQIASIILTTRRDLRDTVASASRRNFGLMKQLGSPLEYAKYNRMLHEIWAPLSEYQFIYERYMCNPVEVTSEVFERLGIDTKFAAQVTQQVSALPVDDYQTTLLTSTHITDPERKLGYGDSLDPPTVRAIEREHEAWLIANGYLASSGQDR